MMSLLIVGGPPMYLAQIMMLGILGLLFAAVLTWVLWGILTTIYHVGRNRGRGWIRASERLPDVGEVVLVAVGDTEFGNSPAYSRFAQLTPQGWKHLAGDSPFLCHDIVTHWKPYPRISEAE